MFQNEKKKSDFEPRRIIIRNYSVQDDAIAVAMVATVIAKGRNCKNLTEYKPKIFGEDDCAVVKHQLNLLSDTFYVWDNLKIEYNEFQQAVYDRNARYRQWKADDRAEKRRLRELEKETKAKESASAL
jgi:transketolase